MGGCQNYGPFLGTLNIRGRTIIGIQKGTIILTTTHMNSTQGIKAGVGNKNSRGVLLRKWHWQGSVPSMLRVLGLVSRAYG